MSIDFATPDQANCSRFCSAIQAPIITSMVVSISAPRRRRSRTSSIAPPSAIPSSTASTSAKKKFTPANITHMNIM